VNNKDKIHKIVQNIFPLINDEIKDSMGPNDIQGWDSMGHLNLVMAISDKFNVNLEFEEVMSIETIGDIIKLLEKKEIQ
jgi:acyl carrier protein